MIHFVGSHVAHSLGASTLEDAARLAVGLQGLGLAEVAYQNALSYAKDRLQGRSLTGPKNPSGPADSILVHPDVRKGLLRIKAFNEGMRSLAYWVGIRIDLEHRHADPAVREAAEDLVALMTPVIKAFLTDKGFDNTNIALQTLGGHGYIKEYGIEQYVRDAKIDTLYEGTTAIQGLDFFFRKIVKDKGQALTYLSTQMQEFAKDLGAHDGRLDHDRERRQHRLDHRQLGFGRNGTLPIQPERRPIPRVQCIWRLDSRYVHRHDS